GVQQPPAALVSTAGILGHGDPQLDSGNVQRKLEARRRYADDRKWRAIDRDGFSQNALVSAEAACPQGMAEHRHVRSRLFLFRPETAPSLRLDPQEWKQVPGDDRTRHLDGRLRIG